MDKVLDLLERHVQWLAIGLGAIVLGLMAWNFVIDSPVKAEIGGQKLGPGDVDRILSEVPTAKLSDAIANKNIPVIEEPHWVQGFEKQMNFDGYTPTLVASSAFPSSAVAIPPKITSPNIPTPNPNAPGQGPIVPIAQLPTLPPATLHEPIMGQSSVVPPAAVAGAPAGGGVQPVANTAKDIAWVCVPFTAPNKALADAFAAIKLHAALQKIAFVQVQLIRQEQNYDGTWGNQSTVATLILPGQDVQQMPPKDSPTQNFLQYYEWAKAHQADILQPKFWQVEKGDQWLPPGPDGPAAAPAVGAGGAPAVAGIPDFDPSRDYTIEDIRKMTAEQKAAYLKAKAERDKAERQRKAEENRAKRGGNRGGGKGGPGASGAGGPSGAGGGGRGGGEYGPNDGGRPPGGGYPGGYPGGRPPGGWIPPEEMDGGNGGPGQAIAPNVPPPPGGDFVPGPQPADWFGWAFDDTAQQGKTYRYKVVYSIKNPVFTLSKANFVTNPDLAKPFAISSDPAKTEWSKEVKIPPRTSFYVATNSMQTNTARIEVFAWQGGVKHAKQIDVAPGDMVGGVDNGVDYTTGWSVIDIKKDPLNSNLTVVVLSDPSGKIVKKDYKTNEAEYQSEKKAAEASAAAAASASAAPPAGGG